MSATLKSRRSPTLASICLVAGRYGEEFFSSSTDSYDNPFE
jgi:hypothetical protein